MPLRQYGKENTTRLDKPNKGDFMIVGWVVVVWLIVITYWLMGIGKVLIDIRAMHEKQLEVSKLILQEMRR